MNFEFYNPETYTFCLYTNGFRKKKKFKTYLNNKIASQTVIHRLWPPASATETAASRPTTVLYRHITE